MKHLSLDSICDEICPLTLGPVSCGVFFFLFSLSFGVFASAPPQRDEIAQQFDILGQLNLHTYTHTHTHVYVYNECMRADMLTKGIIAREQTIYGTKP
jgi:hypothetical protein